MEHYKLYKPQPKIIHRDHRLHVSRRQDLRHVSGLVEFYANIKAMRNTLKRFKGERTDGHGLNPCQVP